MIREIAQIVMAIHSSASFVPTPRATQLAQVIETRSEWAEVDPFIVVAIGVHESRFNERAVSADGEDIGIMQVRGRYYCRGKHNDWLMDGVTNIRVGTHIIKASKDLCRNFLHREPQTQEWLSCYTGSCSGAGMCKPTRLTKIIEDFEICLKDKFDNGTDKDCNEIYWPTPKKKDSK